MSYGTEQNDTFRLTASYVNTSCMEQACGPSSAGADKIRNVHRRQNCEGAWADCAAQLAGSRR